MSQATMHSKQIHKKPILYIERGNKCYVLWVMCRRFQYRDYSASDNKHRAAQKSANPKHSLLLTGMFRLKPASKFVERYLSVVSCTINMEDLISNSFCIFNK
jgi:hypothetical protein